MGLLISSNLSLLSLDKILRFKLEPRLYLVV